jgi:hypothetical protein
VYRSPVNNFNILHAIPRAAESVTWPNNSLPRALLIVVVINARHLTQLPVNLLHFRNLRPISWNCFNITFQFTLFVLTMCPFMFPNLARIHLHEIMYFNVTRLTCFFLFLCVYASRKYFVNHLFVSRSQWPRGLKRRSVAARLLGSRVRISLGVWMFVSCVYMLCCPVQVEVTATGWSLVQRRPTVCLIVCD